MAEKKPSKYSDRGAIGSPEELDAYGVWVKSEPQDLTANMAEAVNFDTEAVPYADFDMEFDNSEESSFDFPALEPEIPEVSIESDEFASDDNDSFDDGIKASYAGASLGRGSEEASTQLLMKIADELSAIRSELSTLKKEFAGVRIEGVSGAKAETRHGGFFDGEEGDDEKITLTGDEMENILTSANFAAPEEDTGFDPQREADEAALKELSQQNESAAETEEEEEIKIDFDNLGISLDDDTGAEAAIDEFPPLEAGADDEFETSSLDEIPPLEEEIMPLEALEEEDDEELQNLRREGASPFTPAPDNSVYLETDPFALDDAALEETTLEETTLEDASLEGASLEETTLEDASLGGTSLEEATLEDAPLEDTSFADLTETAELEEAAPAEMVPLDMASEITEEFSLDDGGLDLDTEAFSLDDESLPAFEEETGALDISAEEKKSDEINIESPLSLEEDTNEEISLESPVSLEEEISLESSIPLEEEPSEEISLESPVSLEDEISFDSPISLEEDTSEEISLESPAPVEEETSEISLESPVPVEEEASEEISLESPAPAEEEISGEEAFDPGNLDLSEAVIDEPDLSAGLVEAPLEEPVLGDISFGDDISLDMDDFGSGIDIDIADSGSAEDTAESPAESPAAEDLAAAGDLAIDDIDTNVELNAEEDIGFAGGLTDDLSLDDIGTSVELDTGDSGVADSPAAELDTGDSSLTDDLSLSGDLSLDDTETSVDLDMGDSSVADAPAAELALDDAEPSVELDTGDSGLADGLTAELALDDAEPSVELDMGDSGVADGLTAELALDDTEPSAELALDDAEPSVELDTGDSGAGLTDDLTSDLALDDFDAGIALDVKDDNISTDSVDDDLTGVIPEGFEINAKDAPISMDDDLEAFDEGEISLPETSAAKTAGVDAEDIDIPANFKSELKSVLSYMDRLLESLPEDKIEEFAKSEYFDSYKKIFKELGLV